MTRRLLAAPRRPSRPRRAFRHDGRGPRAGSSADPSRLRETRGRRRRPALQPHPDGAEGGRADRGAPGRPPRRRRRGPRRRADGRGRDRGGSAGEERHPAELPRHRVPRRGLDDVRRRLLPAVQLPRRRSGAAGPLGAVLLAPGQHVAEAPDRTPGPVREGRRAAAGSRTGGSTSASSSPTSKVEVYVNGAATPCLVVDDLGEAKSGGVALWAGNGSDGSYANLTITPTAPAGAAPESRQTVFQAAATGNLARLRALVEADGKVVNARRPDGLTPLHMAAVYASGRPSSTCCRRAPTSNAVARHSGTPLDVAYEADRPRLRRPGWSRRARAPRPFDSTSRRSRPPFTAWRFRGA